MPMTETAQGDVSLGDTLTYTITATNTGNQTLNNVTVSEATARLVLR